MSAFGGKADILFDAQNARQCLLWYKAYTPKNQRVVRGEQVSMPNKA